MIVASLLFAAFFSGMETAFVSLNKLRLELSRKQGKFPSSIIRIFTDRSGRYLSAMTTGYCLMLILYGVAIVWEFSSHTEVSMSSDFWMMALQIALSFPVFFFAAGYLPKILFRINPNVMLDVFAVPALIFYVLLHPVAWLVTCVSRFLLRTFTKVDLPENDDNATAAGIDRMHIAKEEATVTKEKQDTEHEIKILQNVLDFSSVKIRDCMIPRTDIVGVDENTSISGLKQKFIDTGVSKIIVYRGDIDNIVGYVYSKELFKNPGSLQSMISRVTFVPETMSGNKMMQLFMQEHRSIAIVVDEYGGTSGLLTMEDLIEEIFGDIEDEHDKDNMVEHRIGDNEYLFSGRLEIEYLNETYHLNIPEKDDYDTLAGFILYHHLNFPAAGEIIRIGRYAFVIRKMANTRIDMVQLTVDN
jgi:CBS domain containing-hemolysin-like protein